MALGRQQVLVDLTAAPALRCEKLKECLWPTENLSVEEISPAVTARVTRGFTSLRFRGGGIPGIELDFGGRAVKIRPRGARPSDQTLFLSEPAANSQRNRYQAAECLSAPERLK